MRIGRASASTSTNGFEPLYVVPKERKDRVKKLKEMLAGVDQLYLATDEDREGESIAWHLTEVLKPKIPVHRMVFHEITKSAIEEAFAHPRELDQRLVQAQEARRILDRLYGYEVSPVLWRKIQQGLSAGRVQSVAVRIVVERERERMAFVSAGYWSVEGVFAPATDLDRTFDATLYQVDEARVATGKDFDSSGRAKEGVLTLDQEQATSSGRGASRTASSRVESVEQKPYKRSRRIPLPDLDPPAGSRSEAPLLVVAHHVGGAASLRERIHHLHAHRLDRPVRRRPWLRHDHRSPSSTARSTSRPSPGSTPRRSKGPRRLTRRFGPRVRPSGLRSRSEPRSVRTRPGSTT